MSAMMLRNKAAFGAKQAAPGRSAMRVRAAASSRPLWFPGTTPPAYLDGSLPADFGFDPLRLAEDPKKIGWYVQAELINGRFAMLAVAGILVPEVLKAIGGGGEAANVAWYDVGNYSYWAPVPTLNIISILLFAWAEGRRWQDLAKPGSVNVDPIFPSNKLEGTSVGYPGFDPLNYRNSPDFKTYQVKEIKNGRLAMLAFLGFVGQHNTTGTTPLANLSAHLADPWNTTVFQNELARL